MQNILQAQHHLLALQGFLSCRPWVPWGLPLLCLLLFRISKFLLTALFSTGVFLPISPESIIVLAPGMGLLTLPMYRCSHINAISLCGMIFYMIAMVKHIAVCALDQLHPSLSTPLGLLNLCWIALLLQQWGSFLSHTKHTPSQLRRWIWHAASFYLPITVMPQMLLLLIIM
jgi:hypothetical protein